MSKAKIDRLLNKAGKTVGKLLGNSCVSYRPLNYIDPVQPRNKRPLKPAAFILNSKLTETLDYQFQIFNVEADTSDILPGDIFVDNNATYVIVATREAEGCKAILANTTISVSRHDYTAPTNPVVFVVTNLPANVFAMPGIPDVKTNVGAQVSKANRQEYKIRCYAKEQFLKVGDKIIDANGNSSNIVSVEFSMLGYTLVCQAVK